MRIRRLRLPGRKTAARAAAAGSAGLLLLILPAAPALAGQGNASAHGNSANAPGQVKKQDAPASSQDAPGSSVQSGSDHTQGGAGTSGQPNQPQPVSNADQNPGGANGQCPGGPYCSTRDGSPSGNGNGNGKATGKPCAGCVGKADNKNPKGQMPNGSDRNAGYECDRNHGIGRSNPAHTGCQSSTPPPCETETCPPPCEGSDCTPPSPCTGSDCSPPPCTGNDCSPQPNCEETNSCTCPTDDSACRPPQLCVPARDNNFCAQVKREKRVTTPAIQKVGDQVVRTPASDLPFTGAPISWLLGSGLGLMMAGCLLTVAVRRRPQA